MVPTFSKNYRRYRIGLVPGLNAADSSQDIGVDLLALLAFILIKDVQTSPIKPTQKQIL